MGFAASDPTQGILFAADAINHALTDGSSVRAILALTGVAVLTIVPLAYIHPANCFSVGYGAAVASMSLAMILSFDITVPKTAAELLVYVALVYGIRLASFLAMRSLSVKSMQEQVKSMKRFSFIQVLPLAIVLSGLYACMVSPALFALRRDASIPALQYVGVACALVGLVLEAVADQHKCIIKRRHNITYGEKRFVGPTGGLYAMCRHPNFTFEMLFWTGVLLGGVSSFEGAVAWISGILGWLSIVKIMIGSAKRLDEKQMNMYGGQTAFDEWRTKVTASLIPYVA